MPIKYQGNILVIMRLYDEQGRLTGAGIAGESNVRLPAHAASLIEMYLKRCGWERLERHSEVKRLSSFLISNSTYICPYSWDHLSALSQQNTRSDIDILPT
jgi:hypothetical protein